MTRETKPGDPPAESGKPDLPGSVKRGAIPTPPDELERAQPFVPDPKTPTGPPPASSGSG